MNPVCVQCQIEMRPGHNGVKAIPMAAYGPQEIRNADLWHCPKCKIEILHRFAQTYEIATYDSGFAERLKSYEMDPRHRVIRFWLNQRGREESQTGRET